MDCIKVIKSYRQIVISSSCFLFRRLSFPALLITILSFSPVGAFAQGLTINELMSANASTIADEDGDFSDWIEIYNPRREGISIGGCGLSDDPDEPFKWVFPYVSLPPEGFRLVFASGKNRAAWHSELHTNFRIRAAGEEIILTDPDGNTLIRTRSVVMEPDVSYGRIPDGGDEWFFFYEPSPGVSNGDQLPRQPALSPVTSLPSGFYQPGTRLYITCPDTSATIRYTNDGSIPTDTSEIYSEPLTLDTVTVIRAVSFSEGMLHSRIVNRSYIVDYETELPVVSIITNPPNLWDWETGIYVMGPNADPDYPHIGANFWQDWEIPGFIDFFETDRLLVLSLNAGVKIHGGWSRARAQKSLLITARNDYGFDRIEYQLFPDLPIFSFKSIILRNSGNDWDYSMMRDAMMTGLMSQTDLARQSYRPAVVFLNGVYWGIHNQRERIDEYYLENHFGVNPNRVDIIEKYIVANAGDLHAYQALTAFIQNYDMNELSNYDSVRTMMDVENFIRYQAAEIYIGNNDWPGNNLRCWRPKQEEGIFQWLLYDMDWGFGLIQNFDFNTLALATEPEGPHWPNPPYSTLLFRKLLENESFRMDFIIRSCDLMNNQFRTDQVIEQIRQVREGIEHEMPVHKERWYPNHDWDWHLNRMLVFAHRRRQYMTQHMREEFDLGSTIELTIERVGSPGGRVRVNPFFIDKYPWQGEYFEDLPIKLYAEPFAGYRFAGWEGDINSQSNPLNFVLQEDMTIRARFRRLNSPEGSVVITEINYNCSQDFNPDDWIELFALSGNHQIGGWILRDECDDHYFVIPGQILLFENEHIIIAKDVNTFTNLFPEVDNVIGDFDFGLSSDGDQVRLFNNGGQLVDSVAYDNEPPWPFQPDGHGATLQLIDPVYANEFAHNWAVSLEPHGDPGHTNRSVGVNPDNPPNPLPSECTIISVYPNPFNTATTVTYGLPFTSRVSIELHDITGRRISTQYVGISQPGIHKTIIGAQNLSSGTYIVKIIIGCETLTEKLILIK